MYFKQTPDDKTIAWLLWTGAITIKDVDTVLNDDVTDDDLVEELKWYVNTGMTPVTALTEGISLYRADMRAHLQWCAMKQPPTAKEFLEAFEKVVSRFKTPATVYEGGVEVPNPGFWRNVTEIRVSNGGISVTVDEGVWITENIGEGPYTDLEREPGEGWLIAVARYVATLS